MNATISNIKAVLQGRLTFLDQLSTALNCQNDHPHNVEFKINQLPDAQFQELKFKLKLSSGVTRGALVNTVRQLTTLANA